MGTAHKPKSTRASRGRSDRSHTEPASRQGSAPPGRKPTRPKLRALVAALREIHGRLEAALSVTYLCVIALKAQAADHDMDIALCLECCVEQEIGNQMERIENVLKGAAS